MFVCSRCGSSFSAKHIGIEDCPRCRLRDKVQAPLAFKPFDLSGIEVKGSSGAAGPGALPDRLSR